jgi:hypothetical protein
MIAYRRTTYKTREGLNINAIDNKRQRQIKALLSLSTGDRNQLIIHSASFT